MEDGLTYIKQKLTDLKREKDINTIKVLNSNTHFNQCMNHSEIKIHEKTMTLNNTLELINKYTEHSIQNQQNTYSSQLYMEHFSE